MSRPGLTKKQVKVRGKRGTYLRSYWVRATGADLLAKGGDHLGRSLGSLVGAHAGAAIGKHKAGTVGRLFGYAAGHTAGRVAGAKIGQEVGYNVGAKMTKLAARNLATASHVVAHAIDVGRMFHAVKALSDARR